VILPIKKIKLGVIHLRITYSSVRAVDCIDCAADASVVGAVNEGIDLAASIVPAVQRPWVMISVNDDCRDLHFRKAGKNMLLRKLSVILVRLT
jgi:hypothetical protein